MANRIVSVHAGIYGMGIYSIMLPSSGFTVAYWMYVTGHTVMGSHWKLDQLYDRGEQSRSICSCQGNKAQR